MAPRIKSVRRTTDRVSAAVGGPGANLYDHVL
jgi:hypothetical protein